MARLNQFVCPFRGECATECQLYIENVNKEIGGRCAITVAALTLSLIFDKLDTLKKK